MSEIKWDQDGERLFETGVDRGVLYVRDKTDATYPLGVAWNGLTTVTESPSGAEANPQYADNRKYLNLLSAEDFGGTIEAFTYPDEFMECDGTASPVEGVTIGQQPRSTFGFAYRTKLGNDVVGQDFAYKLHLIYGALAQPSEKAYATVNDSPEAISFSWEITTTAVEVEDYAPTALVVINSSKFTASQMKALEDVLYGRGTGEGAIARLPLPDEVFTLLGVSSSTVQSFATGDPSDSES